MSWRKWLVRALVFSVIGGVTAGAILYQRWTNPAAVRREVIRKLSALFPGAEVSVDSARWRLLGGISVSEVRLSPRNDPEKREFAYIPSAIIYPDKEQMNDGKVAIRKVVLERPRLRIVRKSDGTWNVSGLLAATRPEEPVPILVIQQGTLVVENSGAGWPALEFKDVNLTVVNDSHASMAFQGSGVCELAGAFQFQGTFQRPSQDTTLSIQAPGIAVGPSLMQRWNACCPELGKHAAGLEGTGSVQADFRYRGQISPSWSYQVRWQLRGGRLSHPDLPLPLRDLEAQGQCSAGKVTLEKLTARAGSAAVKLEGTVQGLRPDADFIGKLTVENLPLTPELFARLPAKLQKLQREYAPEGAVDLICHGERSAGKWYRRCEVFPKDISAEYWRFRYRVTRVSGKLLHELDCRKDPNTESLNMDLAGYAGNRPVHIKGDVTGEGPDSAVAVKIWADNVALDRQLLAALDSRRQELARAFHPTGQANIVAEIQRAAKSREFKNRYRIHFHDTTARYDVFPYPLENVEGDLDILPDHWEFRNFSGTHKGCQVTTWGSTQPTAEGGRLVVNIKGRSLLLDSELEAALQPELKKAWKSFRPTGRMDFTATVESLADQAPDVAVTVIPQDCTVQPLFFPYLLSHLSGALHYENQRVRLENLRASHGNTVMTVEAMDVFLKPEGGVYAKVAKLRGTPLLVDEELRQAMPSILRKVCAALGLEAPVQLRTDLVIATFAEGGPAPTVYWDGEMGLQDASLSAGVTLEHVTGKVACQGSCKGDRLQNDPGHSPLMGNLLIQQASILQQPFHDIHCALEVPEASPNVLLLRGIHGGVFGGEVYGETKIELVAPYGYELNLSGAGLRLEEFAGHNLKPGFKMSGIGNARLYLSGMGSDRKTLQGRGTLDVPKGKIYELNFLLDLLKILNLRVPDGTAFEEAHAVFAIKGDRVRISRLDLFGTPFSLGGKGEMNLDGSNLHLEFYAVWARVMQVLPPIIKEIPKVLSQQFLKITLHGSLGVKVESTKEPVPILVEPLKELLKAMQGRKTMTPAGVGSGN
jgi:hypothetical protein